MKVAVTGASGHIGSAVCRHLIAQGHEVVALVRKDVAAIQDLPLKMMQGDVLNRESLIAFMQTCDAVIHTAAAIDLSYPFNQKVYDINVTGTKNVLEVAKETGIKKIVHLSSIHAFSHSPHNIPLDESREFVSDSALFYDRTKRNGHKLALETARSGMFVVVVCPTSAAGPPDHKPSKLGKAVIDIYKGYVPAVIEGGFDFADVRDIAVGIVAALTKGISGETYILGGKYYTIQQFAEIVLEQKGSKKKLKLLPMTVAKAVLPFIRFYSLVTGKPPLYDKPYLDILKDGNKNVLSIKAQRELGYQSRELKETLTDTIQWFKNSGWI